MGFWLAVSKVMEVRSSQEVWGKEPLSPLNIIKTACLYISTKGLCLPPKFYFQASLVLLRVANKLLQFITHYVKQYLLNISSSSKEQ